MRTLYDELAERPDAKQNEGPDAFMPHCLMHRGLVGPGFYSTAKNIALGYGRNNCTRVDFSEFPSLMSNVTATGTAMARQEEELRRTVDQRKLLQSVSNDVNSTLRQCYSQLGIPNHKLVPEFILCNNVFDKDFKSERCISLPIYRYPVYFSSCEMLYTRSYDNEQKAVHEWR